MLAFWNWPSRKPQLHRNQLFFVVNSPYWHSLVLGIAYPATLFLFRFALFCLLSTARTSITHSVSAWEVLLSFIIVVRGQYFTWFHQNLYLLDALTFSIQPVTHTQPRFQLHLCWWYASVISQGQYICWSPLQL